ERYSVDVAVIGGHQVTTDDTSSTSLDAGIAGQIQAIDGVSAMSEITRGIVEAPDFDLSMDVGMGDGPALTILDAIDPAAAAVVMRDPAAVAPFNDTTLLVSRPRASGSTVKDGDTITVRGTGGTAVDLTVKVVPELPAGLEIAVTTATLRHLDPAAATN